MSGKMRPTVSAAIDAVNDISSPLDFSFKSLAGIQGLFCSVLLESVCFQF